MAALSLKTQSSTIFSTVLIMVLSALPAYFMTNQYLLKKQRSMAFWSLGLWLFTVGVLEEVAFASGVYSQLLIKSYFLVVAVLEMFLAIGSVELLNSRRIRNAYFAYSAATVAFLPLLSLSPALVT